LGAIFFKRYRDFGLTVQIKAQNHSKTTIFDEEGKNLFREPGKMPIGVIVVIT